MTVSIGQIQRLSSPNPFALLSTRREDGGTNLMAISWWTYASNHPPTVAVCLSKKGYSGARIRETGEFVLNLVGEDLKEAAMACGSCSGRSVDKAEKFGIPLTESTLCAPMSVAGCRANLECRLVQTVDAADHDLFLAEVVEARVDESVDQLFAFDGYGRLDTV